MEFAVRPDSYLINHCPSCDGPTYFPGAGEVKCQNCGNEYTHAMVEWVETPRHEEFLRWYADERMQ